ncbi:hypothetical protein HYPDE_24843 [Hyphomicrobium denitrificans 1NES1]|uniref:Uncharacterized protein n=1 Tax=Hyphomicrobium denitrificans 1NES1 TaxID=670307 RepID=N0B144_9HYPH|nr:hypothetical protein HYPDE_24843 [Hyphomicrobium denitrificans 1NES1]
MDSVACGRGAQPHCKRRPRLSTAMTEALRAREWNSSSRLDVRVAKRLAKTANVVRSAIGLTQE